MTTKTNKNGAGTSTLEPNDTALPPTLPKPIAKGVKGEPIHIELPKLKINKLELDLVGDSSLIVHNWSTKAIQEIKDKQAKRAKGAKEARNPKAEYESSLYPLPDGGYGFPCIAFKDAAVSACTHVSNITKVEARGAFHVNLGEQFIRIEGCEPNMREDMVRIGMGVADIRYRGEFKRWHVRLQVQYNANVLSPDEIVNLFNTSGFAVGVGEWRPERDGANGMYHVAEEGEIELLFGKSKGRK